MRSLGTGGRRRRGQRAGYGAPIHLASYTMQGEALFRTRFIKQSDFQFW